MVSPSVDANITLWQFLWELLNNRDGKYRNIIEWTNNDGEFKLINAEAVARLWGKRKNKPQMNYEKMSRALRYYYDKDIIKKVNGQKFVYRFSRRPGFPISQPYQIPGYGNPCIPSNQHAFFSRMHPYFTHPAFQYNSRLYLEEWDRTVGRFYDCLTSPNNSVGTSDSVGSNDRSSSCDIQSPELRNNENIQIDLPSTSRQNECLPTSSKSSLKPGDNAETEEGAVIPNQKGENSKRIVTADAVENAEVETASVISVTKKEDSAENAVTEANETVEGKLPKRQKPEPLDLSSTGNLASSSDLTRQSNVPFNFGTNNLLGPSPILSPFNFFAASFPSSPLFPLSPQNTAFAAQYQLLGALNSTLTTPTGSPGVASPGIFNLPASPEHAALMAQHMAASALTPFLPIPNNMMFNFPKQ